MKYETPRNNDRFLAKKSLGQNFLTSEAALAHIIEAGKLSASDIVVEAGPGKGVLTKQLLEKVRKVIAVEKDHRLIEPLQITFKEHIESGKLVLVQGDVLEFKPSEHGLPAKGYKVIANIPYYITGHFIRKFLESSEHPSHMVIMIQKEVARRIMAHDKKESLLSISVKAYGIPYYISTVKRGSFQPQPNVDSAILSIESISKDFFENISEEHFFNILKNGFGKKRKKLINNIGEKFDQEQTRKAFETCGLDSNIRAEDMTLSGWKCVAQNITETFRLLE